LNLELTSENTFWPILDMSDDITTNSEYCLEYIPLNTAAPTRIQRGTHVRTRD